MTTLFARQALTADGWAEDVLIKIDAQGRIGAVSASAQGTDAGERVDILLPAPANLHSHAFQRAMAGLTERRGPDPRDSFWTWRQVMFRFLDRLTPEDVQAITAFTQMQMLEAGFASNVEFHYLHHQPGGAPYARPEEMSARIAAAAHESGIGLTLLPVLYQQGGCDGRALGPGQIRFGNDPGAFARLVEGARAALAPLPADTRLGLAPHSLRAVSPDGLAALVELGEKLGGPIHMHLAEQPAEVEEVQAIFGARPAEWLLANAPVDARWCLIHCTQMLPAELKALAQSNAVAGICPITEASLGDGIFDAVTWQQAGGRFGVGSDSNIRISLAEELRMLEYSQRLRERARAVLATPEWSTGRVLFEGAARGGAQAAGRESGAIAPGMWADLVALDGQAVDLAGRRGDTILDAWVFAGSERGMVRDVWSAGRHMVRDGRHLVQEQITRRYLTTLHRLRDAI